MNFLKQLRKDCDKAATATSSLGMVMTIIGGPSESKRRLLLTIVQSILLCGVENFGGTQ